MPEIAQCGPGGEQAARWVSFANRIVSDTGAHAVHPLRALAALTGDPWVDAALLLPALLRDSRLRPAVITTVHAIASQLTEDGDCYRHRPDERTLGQSEGAFLLCAFLMTLAYAQQRDHLTAARGFERNRTASAPGLWEEFDVTQRLATLMFGQRDPRVPVGRGVG